MDALKGIDPDKLTITERSVLRRWCQTALARLGAESERNDQEQDSKEMKEKNETKQGAKGDDANGWTPADPAFVFVGVRDTKWPTSSGTSRREKDVARRKEQAHA